MRTRVLFIAAAVTLLSVADAFAQAPTTRESMPWTLSAAGNLTLPSVGVDLSRQLGNRVAVGIQGTQLLIAHVDVSLRLRVFFVAGETSGLYLGANGHMWYSPMILNRVSPAVTGELGYERRRTGGFTFGIGVGAGLLYEQRDEAFQSDRTEPLVMLNVRVGKSWGD